MTSYAASASEALHLADLVPPNGAPAAGPRLVLLDPVRLDFGPVNVGEHLILGVRITARGSGITLLGFVVGGDNSADFQAEARDAPGEPISLGGGCTLRVTFAPRAGGTRIGVVQVLHAGGNPYEIPLTGLGT